MEFGRHLRMGIWGLADKMLPVVYGLGYVWLVIRVLPEEEFGNFVLVQEIFLIISGLATAFALQPMLKFAAEAEADLTGIVSASLWLNAGFVAAASLVVALLSEPAAALLNSPSLAPLLLYVPAMLAASFARNFTMTLLQARFRIREVFWMDAVHFLGAPFLVWVVSRLHQFDTALDLVLINLVSLGSSSLAGLWFARGMARLTLRPSTSAVRQVWDYGKYTLGGIVSSLVGTRADSFILSAFSGPVQVAVYNSAKVFVRLYEMATQVAQMFLLPAASRLSSQGDAVSLKTLTEKAVLFLIVGLLPVTLMFIVLPELLIAVLYSGRYADAVPVIRIFSLLTFVVPLTAVGTNVIMGLGHARASFILGAKSLIVTLAALLICIPVGGVPGAGAGYLLGAVITAVLTGRTLNRYVRISIKEVMRRTHDIRMFLADRL
ncbi:MAG: oligosaccharide flippase family protein [Bacteroidota bacterium]